jgi:hypothetical protein
LVVADNAGNKKIGCLPIVVLAFVVGWFLYNAGMDKPSAEDTADKAEDRRKGFTCLSAWDGSYRELETAVEKSLRDPDSFEHVETKITPVDVNNEHLVVMEFRAKNGFGGKNVGTATATIDGSCKMKSWQMLSD